ncbi:MAG: DEAD/DEAH box helicase [Candidatus Hydrogenedens sp.]
MDTIQTLRKSGFPEALLKEYQNFCYELLPLQREAIENRTLFSEPHLLIHAPTSAGKTFLAELAMVHTYLQRGKSVYLVPLRVQAEEIFRTLRERYKRHGIQILISTSDYRHHDPWLEQGRFHIAVVVYEKMFQLIARQPSVLNKIGLMVFDDIDLIFDPERGLTADFLLTRCLGSSVRCMALSACLPKPAMMAEWMKAKLIQSGTRPVPLKKGVMYNGIFYYSDETGQVKEEYLFDTSLFSELPYLQGVKEFVHRGETCLIFMKTRNEVRSFAWELSESLNLPPAEQASEQIKLLEPTRARDALLHAFQHGIGFHYSDLLPEERQIVENAFRKGEIRVLVATSTLAKGLNLPVQNVFISHEKWYYTDRQGNGGNMPLSSSEYENMAGRAGRYGYTDQPARAILVANSEEEKDLLLSTYILKSSSPTFLSDEFSPVHLPMLSVIASYETVTMEHIVEFFQSCWRVREQLLFNNNQNTYSVCANDFMDSYIRRGFCIKKSLHRFGLTPRGQIVATKGVSPETIEQLEQWLNLIRGRERDELDALFISSITPDAWLPQFELSINEFHSQIYMERLKEYPLKTPWDVMTPLQKFQQGLAEPNIHEVKGLKIAFVLREWMNGKLLSEIEEEFYVSAGQVVQAGVRIAWILEVLAQLAEMMNINNVDDFRRLSEQVRWGIPAEGLSLARTYEGSLSRSQMLSLYANGIYTIEQIAKIPPGELLKYIPEDKINIIKQLSQKIRTKNFKFPSLSHSFARTNKNHLEKTRWTQTHPIQTSKDIPYHSTPKDIITQQEESPSTAENHTQEGQKNILLVLDMKRPGEVWLEGKKIRLPEKQYRLLYLLSRNAGCCVSYDEVYKELWNDIIVEDAQMAFQKCMLLQKLCEVSPLWKERLRTIPKRGFILDLPPEKVLLKSTR